MSDTKPNFQPPHDLSHDEIMSMAFAGLVMQQSNMALMLLGAVPDPHTGEIIHDVETAQMVIDQLEMLELKTKGNLNPQETALLKQSLMATRMAFVKAVENPQSGAAPEVAAPPQSAPLEAAPDADADKKKFTKKY